MSEASLSGKLLVATPPLVDGNFDRTVVLLLEHSRHGALGLVLNRPTDTPVREHLAPWATPATPPEVFFTGGPVQPEGVIALASAGTDGASEHFSPLLGRLGTLDLGVLPDEVGVELEHLRIFVGHSGWGPQQLEGELEAGAWVVVPSEPSDPFDPDPRGLWRRVLGRQGGRLAWMAHFPDDPEAN